MIYGRDGLSDMADKWKSWPSFAPAPSTGEERVLCSAWPDDDPIYNN